MNDKSKLLLVLKENELLKECLASVPETYTNEWSDGNCSFCSADLCETGHEPDCKLHTAKEILK